MLSDDAIVQVGVIAALVFVEAVWLLALARGVMWALS